MKTPLENIQKPQHESVQRAEQVPSAVGEATIVDNRPAMAVQRKLRSAMDGVNDNNSPIQRKRNNTGLPDNLKTGMENLTGLSLDDVRVYRNSNKPAQLQAHAYAQGTDIYLGRGKEKHLAHELGHVVQQKQGRVKPTMQFKGGVYINDDTALEKEADVMGDRACRNHKKTSKYNAKSNGLIYPVVQRIEIPDKVKLDENFGNSENILRRALEEILEVDGDDMTGEEKEQYTKTAVPFFSKLEKQRNTELHFNVYSEVTGRDKNSGGRTKMYVYNHKNEKEDVDNEKGRMILLNRRVNKFEIEINLTPHYGKLKRGSAIQLILHELTVHAEDFLDLIEAYWERKPFSLDNAGTQHYKFLMKAYERYEMLANRFDHILPEYLPTDNNYKSGFVGKHNDFRYRESDDKFWMNKKTSDPVNFVFKRLPPLPPKKEKNEATDLDV